MKQILIVIGICLFLSVTPVFASDCGCDEYESISRNNQTILGKLTSEDIATMQEQAEIEGWTFTVGENSATQYPLDQLCGLVEPENWWVDADFDPCEPTRDLPEQFDWRDVDGIDYTTPVKNQGSCGSCWAFGTVGPLESNILIHDGEEVDLSEQWLVSCNRNGWSCDGGWFAHDYHQWKTDPFNDTGAVLEENFLYDASDLPCDGPYPHDYFIDSWKYIGWAQSIPQVDSIKQAILDYGPVSVAVAVDSAFGAYTSGVFYSNYTGINHAVTLVGWNDNFYWEGEYYGVWILRNSWSPDWGDNGHMYIMYNSSRVGYAACYVDYPQKTNIEIKGGLLGLTVNIKNVGDETTTDLDWSITVKGGMFDTIDISSENSIPSLEPGETISKRVPRFGFGIIDIMVTVDPSNAGMTSKRTNALLFGLLLIPYK
ncbi:MAG: hypothetical protein KAI20_00925 [Thermoplasmatales archaeon]|nr:hypothetical protein [Thermoplasmatales archaeon]